MHRIRTQFTKAGPEALFSPARNEGKNRVVSKNGTTLFLWKKSLEQNCVYNSAPADRFLMKNLMPDGITKNCMHNFCLRIVFRWSAIGVKRRIGSGMKIKLFSENTSPRLRSHTGDSTLSADWLRNQGGGLVKVLVAYGRQDGFCVYAFFTPLSSNNYGIRHDIIYRSRISACMTGDCW